jgi:hypothetical protein
VAAEQYHEELKLDVVGIAEGNEPGARCSAGPAVGDERERLWRRMRELDENVDGYAALRAQGTAVVVLEPRMVAE